MRCWWMPALVFGARLLARLPQRALPGTASVLATVLAPWLARRRRIAARNLLACFPELDAAARARLLRDNLRATVAGALELLRAWYAPDAALEGLATIEGLPLLRDALAQGRGVLLLTGHFTHTELAVRLLSRAAGVPIGGVVRPNNDACLEQALDAARRQVFGTVLGKKDVRGLLRELRGGRAMVYSADQDFNYQHAFVPFLGVPAATLTTTPELVRRSGATMLVMFFHRDAGGIYRIALRPAWPGWRDGAPQDAAAIYMRELGAYVAQHPAQYLWVHRRFKTRPPGEPSFY
jgi:KDO2-lipid IV(A) lauroyltransferase